MVWNYLNWNVLKILLKHIQGFHFKHKANSGNVPLKNFTMLLNIFGKLFLPTKIAQCFKLEASLEATLELKWSGSKHEGSCTLWDYTKISRGCKLQQITRRWPTHWNPCLPTRLWGIWNNKSYWACIPKATRIINTCWRQR